MTYKYSNSELVDMLLIYGECCQNSAAARRRYAELYPSRHLPGVCVFNNVAQRARDTGKLQPTYQGRGREKTSHVLEAEDAVLEAIEKNPTLSTREIARNLNVSHYTVWKTLKETQGSRSHYYNCQKIYQLEPEDYLARARFCQWVIDTCIKDTNFSSEILFTDEACFTSYGIANVQDQNNPISENEQQRFSVNVWAGMVANFIVGPFILVDGLNEETYLNFLQYDLQLLFEEVPISIRQKMWFQHGGTAPYFTSKIRKHLNNQFKDRWMGQEGPTAWPPRSSDLNPVEFFLWGYLKQIIYETEINDVTDLKNRINLAANMLKKQKILEQRRESLLQRAHKCVQAGGSTFQHLL